MRALLIISVGSVILGGCASGDQPAGSAPSVRPPPTPAAGPTGAAGESAGDASITRAGVQLSVSTHRGAAELGGLRISGRCSGAPVMVVVGHAPPYPPLRTVRSAAINRINPPKQASLTAPCRNGRFILRRRNVTVRQGSGPVTARLRAPGSPAVPLAVRTFAME